jgi:hypothetical protein
VGKAGQRAVLALAAVSPMIEAGTGLAGVGTPLGGVGVVGM